MRSKNGEAVQPVLVSQMVDGFSSGTRRKTCSFYWQRSMSCFFSFGYLACASAVHFGFAERKDLILADKNLHSSLFGAEFSLVVLVANDLLAMLLTQLKFWRMRKKEQTKFLFSRVYIRWKDTLQNFPLLLKLPKNIMPSSF